MQVEPSGLLELQSAIVRGLDIIGESLTLFTQEPAIYFVAMALIGAGAGVARRFVPMKKR